MITVRFFGSLREQLGSSELQLDRSPEMESVRDVRTALVDLGGEAWQSALESNALITALNHRVVDLDTSVADGDELAFYPPVTGG